MACQLSVVIIGDTIGPMVDPSAQPVWKRTGYKFFPYAAQQSGQWLGAMDGVDDHNRTGLGS